LVVFIPDALVGVHGGCMGNDGKAFLNTMAAAAPLIPALGITRVQELQVQVETPGQGFLDGLFLGWEIYE